MNGVLITLFFLAAIMLGFLIALFIDKMTLRILKRRYNKENDKSRKGTITGSTGRFGEQTTKTAVGGDENTPINGERQELSSQPTSKPTSDKRRTNKLKGFSKILRR